MPSLTSIHDTNLLIWALEALARDVEAGQALLEHLKAKIEYRQSHWGLTEREAEHARLSDMVLQELDVLHLYDRAGTCLTDDGKRLLERIETEKSRAPIIEYLAPKLLTEFDDVRAFLQLLDQRGDVKIPKVPGKKELGLEVGHRGKRKSEVETPEALQQYIDATFNHIQDHLPDPKVYQERATYWQANSRGKRHYDVMRTIVRDASLADFKYGDVKYKVVRDRLWYLGIVNWSEHLAEFEGEVCYPLYRKGPNGGPGALRYDTCIGQIGIAAPGKEDASFDEFVRVLWGRFSDLSRRTIGYVPIPDLRDATCRELRISDYAFNDLFRRFAKACLENKVPFSCNWETAQLAEITQKRLPIEVPGIGLRKAVSIHKLG